MDQGLIHILDNFREKKILVIGDIMLDKSILGDVTRISPEAPVQVVNAQKETYAPGGAANTANNISALGGNVYVVGVAGNDNAKDILLGELKKKKINTEGVIISDKKPTIQKIRIIGKGQQLLRVDYEDTNEIGEDTRKKIFDYIKEMINKIDAIIISDYAKGIVTKDLFNDLMKVAGNKIVVVDPKTRYAVNYKDVTLITPNNHEAGIMANMDINNEEDLINAGKILMQTLGSNILITKGEKGMSLFEKNSNITNIPTKAKEVYDVTGAGDTVVAVVTLALASKASMKDAAILSNYAAGIVVGKLGTATTTVSEIKKAIEDDKKNNS
jgi:rfaE bifunctional protein kinase chain/domain